jgi:hypothetical protein
MREVNSRDAFLLPALAKGGFIFEKTQLFYDVIHDEISINRRRLALQYLPVCVAQLAHLRYVESLIRIEPQHGRYHLP